MGCFKNTNYTDNNGTDSSFKTGTGTSSLRSALIGSLTSGMLARIKSNPFYFFNSTNMTVVTFYNINRQYTTLDETLKNTNNFIGPASGLRFDKIHGVVLYGMQKIELNIDNGEWGTEADPVEGECILAPNSFNPYQESYFTIDYLQTKKTVFFRVTSVNVDTLPNGANFYKLGYKLEGVGYNIDPQVVGEYQFVASNIGTQFPVVIPFDIYGAQTKYASIIEMLNKFYYELFFYADVQTFVFRYGPFGYFFYDPYLIHFMMKNHLLSSDGYEYHRIEQPAATPPYMQIDYEGTLFRLLEDNTSVFKYYEAYGLMVQDPMSLLTHRMSPYYMITFRDDDGAQLGGPFLNKITLFDTDMINLIPGANPLMSETEYMCNCDNILKALDQNRKYYTIIYNYLAGNEITSDMIEQIKHINFTPCKELYYLIPVLIYIIQNLSDKLNDNMDAYLCKSTTNNVISNI